MIVPTRRLALLLALGLVPGAAVAVLRIVGAAWDGLGLLAGWDGVVLGLAALDALSLRKPGLQVQRYCPRVLSVGRNNPVRLQLTARVAVNVTCTDDGAERVVAQGLPTTVALAAHVPTMVRYWLHPERRGKHTLGAIWLRWPTRLGLWTHQLRLELHQDLHVYPDLAALRGWDVLASDSREQRMTRAARQRGGESEFERLREYTRDDDVRRIDWRATARRRTVIAREFQLERDQNVVFVLDLGRWMTAESGGLSHLDRALNASLMLAHMASKAGDQTGLFAFDRQVRAWLPPLGGPGGVRRLTLASYDLYPSLVETDFRTCLTELRRRLRKRSLIILFTQVADPTSRRQLLPMLRALQPTHLPLVVALRDEELEDCLQARENGHVDMYVRGVAADEVLARERAIDEFGRAGALVLHTRAADLTSGLLQRYLEVKARQRL